MLSWIWQRLSSCYKFIFILLFLFFKVSFAPLSLKVLLWWQTLFFWFSHQVYGCKYQSIWTSFVFILQNHHHWIPFMPKVILRHCHIQLQSLFFLAWNQQFQLDLSLFCLLMWHYEWSMILFLNLIKKLRNWWLLEMACLFVLLAVLFFSTLCGYSLMINFPDESLLERTYLLAWINLNIYRYKIISFKINRSVMLLNIFPRFTITNKLSDFTPVSKTVSKLRIIYF